MLPAEARQDGTSKAGRIDLDHLFMPKELVEATPEVPARLHHHHPCRRDVEAKGKDSGPTQEKAAEAA